ncbi:hypothetical protein Tco_0019409 [Tanacetum coccineum]
MVCLVDDKTLDIAGVRYVILKTSFGTNWTLKDVRYISGLKRRLISVRQLDEEGYHVGFGDQQWKVTKGSLVVACGTNVEACIWLSEDKETAKQELRIMMLKMVPETPLQSGVAERLSRTFRAESTGLHAEASKMLWADSVAAQMKCDTAFGIRRVTRLSEAEISYLWTRFMEPENDSIVAEHRLGSEITPEPDGELRIQVRGPKTVGASRRVEDRMKNTLKTEHPLRREAPRLHRYEDPPESPGLRNKAGKNASQRIVDVQGKGRAECCEDDYNQGRKLECRWNELCRTASAPSYGDDMLGRTAADMAAVPTASVSFPCVRDKDRYLRKALIFVEDSWNEEPCSDVHQVGDEIEVEVLRSFNWPPSELITEDGFLPERGGAYHVVQIEWDRWSTLEQVACGCRSVRTGQFSTGRAVGTITQFSMGRAVGTIVQFGTSLSSLAQSLIISLWFDPVDYHNYPRAIYRTEVVVFMKEAATIGNHWNDHFAMVSQYKNGRRPRISRHVASLLLTLPHRDACHKMQTIKGFCLVQLTITKLYTEVGTSQAKGFTCNLLRMRVIFRGQCMSAEVQRITSLKCVLTQEHLDAVCAKYFVPEEVHPQLPSSNATMHERPTGKVGMYTRFFDYANYHMDLNAFIHTADPRKVRIVERARAENEGPIVTVAKHRTVTLFPTSVVRSSGELSASVEREFVGDASVGDGGDQGFDSVAGQDNVESTVPVVEPVEAEIPRPKRSKKKRVTYDSEGLPAASHPPKRLRADYGTTGGSATRGKSPSILNRLLQDFCLTVEQGIPALPTLPFITSSITASPLEEGGDSTDFRAKSADPEVDSVVRSAALVMTKATTVITPADVSKDKSAPHPSIFGSSSSSEKTDRTLSLFIGRSGSGFDAGSIRAEEAVGTGLEETYVPEWMVTRGFELNDRRLYANMIDHFTPPAFFKTVRGMEHEQLFTEFNVSAARNLSLSSEVRMHAEYNISEKRKWRSLAEEKNILLEAKDKEIEDLKSRLLKAEEESAEEHNILLDQECNSLKLKVTGLESTITEKDHKLSDLGASSSSLKSQNQSLVNQVHKLEISSADLREKLEMYEGSLKQLEEFQDNLIGPLRTRLAEIDVDFTRCCMRFQESFHPHLLNVVAGRRWLLTHGMKLRVVKCLNSTEYMEALGHAFGRAIEKGMQEGLAAGIEHGQAGRCLTDLEAYIPSAEAYFNSAIRDLRDLNFLLLQELSNKKDASTWDIMDLLCLDDVVAETLGMTDLQPDVSQLMVPVHHKQDRVVIGSQALSVALDVCRGRVKKMERNLIERLPFLKDVFVSIDDPLSAEALIETPAEVPATNVLSTMVIVPPTSPFVSIEDYDNPDLADEVPENATLRSESEGNINASAGGSITFSQLDDEARDAVL